MTAFVNARDDSGNLVQINLDHITHMRYISAGEKTAEDSMEVYLSGGHKVVMSGETASEFFVRFQTGGRNQ
jgi:hypothetical protein